MFTLPNEMKTLIDNIFTTPDIDPIINHLNESLAREILTKSLTVLPPIKRVIFSNPTTIVFFEDGTKAVVKTSAHDKFDKEHGILYAIFKRIFGCVNPLTHEVETNGCGTYLKRLVEGAFDQNEKPKKTVKAAKAPTKKTSTKRGGNRR